MPADAVVWVEKGRTETGSIPMISGLAQPVATGIGRGGRQRHGKQGGRGSKESRKLTHVFPHLERCSMTAEPTTLAFSLILRMILSENSANPRLRGGRLFRDHALDWNRRACPRTASFSSPALADLYREGNREREHAIRLPPKYGFAAASGAQHRNAMCFVWSQVFCACGKQSQQMFALDVRMENRQTWKPWSCAPLRRRFFPIQTAIREERNRFHASSFTPGTMDMPADGAISRRALLTASAGLVGAAAIASGAARAQAPALAAMTSTPVISCGRPRPRARPHRRLAAWTRSSGVAHFSGAGF
jgi:hypothetical protein